MSTELREHMRERAAKWIASAPDEPELIAAALTVELRLWLRAHAAIHAGFRVEVTAPTVEGASWGVWAYDECNEPVPWNALDESARSWS